MPVRTHVDAFDTWTASRWNELMSQQPLVFADHRARDHRAELIPENILSASPAFTPTQDVTVDPPAGRSTVSTDWTVLGQSQTWTVDEVLNTSTRTRLLLVLSERVDPPTAESTEAVRAAYEEFRRQMTALGAWFRLVPTADPLGFVSVPIWDFNRDHNEGMSVRPGRFVMKSGVEYRWEFYVPAVVEPIRPGTIGITLNDNLWWIFGSGAWQQLNPPPPTLRQITAAELDIWPPRDIGFEQAPAVVSGREILDLTRTGLLPRPQADGTIIPFDTPLTETAVEYRDGWTHVIEGNKTVTAVTDCEIQALAIGRGGPGQGFTIPSSRRAASEEHEFGGAGGGAGGIVHGTFFVRKGEQIVVNGASGELRIGGRLVLDAPGGGSGGSSLNALGSQGGGSAHNDRATRYETADEDPQPRWLLPVITRFGQRLQNLRASGLGRGILPRRGSGEIRSPGSFSASGGSGGSTLRSPFRLAWTPVSTDVTTGAQTGGILMGEGGRGGGQIAGRAGVGYGGGGGGSGTGLATDVRPYVDETIYQITERRTGHAIACVVSGTNSDGTTVNTVRYRTALLTQAQYDDSSYRPVWSDWSDWETAPHSFTIYALPRYAWLYVEVEVETVQAGGHTTLGRRPGSYDIIDIGTALPGPLSVRITERTDSSGLGLDLRWSVDHVILHGTERPSVDTGVRWKYYPQRSATPDPNPTVDWSTRGWEPAEVNGAARWNLARTHHFPVGSIWNAVTFYAQASNPNGQTTPAVVGTWLRGATPTPPTTPTTPDPPAPGIPSVNLVYNTASSNLVGTWSATNAAEYRHRWTQTLRTGVEQRGPGSAPDYWSPWQTRVSSSWNIGAAVGQFTLEVEARNTKPSDNTVQNAPASGSASQTFALPPDPEQPDRPTIVPPARPTIVLGNLTSTGTTLRVSWSAARAVQYQWRRTFTTSGGTSTTSAWSAWGTATSTTLTVPINVVRVAVEVRARNGGPPPAGAAYNISSRTASVPRDIAGAPPRVTGVSIFGIQPADSSVSFGVNISAANASAFRFRVLIGSRQIVGWNSWSSSSQRRVTLTSSQISFTGNQRIVVQAQARGANNQVWPATGTSPWPSAASDTWDTHGNVGAVIVTESTSISPFGATVLTFRWTAQNATQYRYAYGAAGGGYGPWSAWSSRTSPPSTFTVPAGQNTVRIRVQARVSASSLPRAGLGRWVRAATPPPTTPTPTGTAPANLRVNLTVDANGWRASWTATGTGIRYSYVITWTLANGQTTARPRVQAGSNLTASGGLVTGATQVSISVTAVNAGGTSPAVTVSRQLSAAPAITAIVPTPYFGTSGHRNTTLVLHTERATEVRYSIRPPPGSAIPAADRTTSWTQTRPSGINSWQVRNWYTGVGQLVITVYARNSSGTVSRDTTYSLNYPFIQITNIRVTDFTQTDTTIGATVRITAAGASQYRYRLRRGAHTVRDWSAWSTNPNPVFTIGTAAAVGGLIIEGQARSQTESSEVASVTGDFFGGVGRPSVTATETGGNLELRWTAANAAQYWWSITVTAGGLPPRVTRTVTAPRWQAVPGYTINQIPSRVVAVIRARRSSSHLYRETTFTWPSTSRQQAPSPDNRYLHAPPPPGGYPEGYVPPPEYEPHTPEEPETARQTRTFSGGARKNGVVVIRHAEYGTPLRRLPLPI